MSALSMYERMSASIAGRPPAGADAQQSASSPQLPPPQPSYPSYDSQRAQASRRDITHAAPRPCGVDSSCAEFQSVSSPDAAFRVSVLLMQCCCAANVCKALACIAVLRLCRWIPASAAAAASVLSAAAAAAAAAFDSGGAKSRVPTPGGVQAAQSPSCSVSRCTAKAAEGAPLPRRRRRRRRRGERACR